MNYHPHVHSLMLHGAADGAGDFQQLDSVNSEYLQARFARRVLDALLGEGLIDHETVENMLSWEHSGFHVFVGEPIEPENQESRRFVAQYLKKSPVSLKHLELIETGSEPVLRSRSFKNNLAEHKDFGPLADPERVEGCSFWRSSLSIFRTSGSRRSDTWGPFQLGLAGLPGCRSRLNQWADSPSWSQPRHLHAPGLPV